MGFFSRWASFRDNFYKLKRGASFRDNFYKLKRGASFRDNFCKLKRGASLRDGLLLKIKPTGLLFEVLRYIVFVGTTAWTNTFIVLCIINISLE